MLVLIDLKYRLPMMTDQIMRDYCQLQPDWFKIMSPISDTHFHEFGFTLLVSLLAHSFSSQSVMV